MILYYFNAFIYLLFVYK